MAAVEHSTRSHALLSASRAERWLNCPPSARLEEKFDEAAPSKYAEEGTLAHEIAEVMLRARFMITPVDDCTKELRKLKKSNLYKAEMDEFLRTYLDYVTDQLVEAKHKTKDAVILLEERLDFSRWVEQGFGTGDSVIIADGVLEVIDLKYGQGVSVYAEKNPQLMLYGLGALEKYDMLYDIHTVKLTIVQPRQERIDSWETTPEDLFTWGEEVVRPTAALAYTGKGETKCGHWCKWCRVKGMCAKLAQANLDLAKDEFKEPQLLSDERLAEIFQQIPMLQDWASAVADYLLKQALAGKNIPGYKVVEGRTQRKWADEEQVKEILSVDHSPEEYTVTKLAGIPAIEKLLKKDFTPLLGDLVVTPPGNPTLVPISDKRPAIVGVDQARADFKDPE